MLSVATVLGSAYIVLFTSLLGVDSVRVEGARSVPESRVLAAASIEHGKPLLRLDTAAIRTRVSGLTALSSVAVSRSWPSSVVISVTERTSVAVIDTGQGYRLVDRAGVVFRTVPDNPNGLPVLEVSQAVRHDRARRATTAVVAALPGQLRTRVATVSAESEHTVRLTLDDGTTVIWGSAERSKRKAKVLAALLTQPGSVYDVSTPALPTVR